MLRSSQRRPATETLLTALINDIVDASPEPLALVLDDFHVITDQHIHNGLAFLLDHLPPHMHLVVSSRSDPPWPLARLRARSEMIELRQADLRFTPDEAAEFLNQVMGPKISAENAAALATRTEGWIAGLQNER